MQIGNHLIMIPGKTMLSYGFHFQKEWKWAKGDPVWCLERLDRMKMACSADYSEEKPYYSYRSSGSSSKTMTASNACARGLSHHIPLVIVSPNSSIVHGRTVFCPHDMLQWTATVFMHPERLDLADSESLERDEYVANLALAMCYDPLDALKLRAKSSQ
jgi:hypothetical protein